MFHYGVVWANLRYFFENISITQRLLGKQNGYLSTAILFVLFA
ncbi:hypothetical protein FM107_04645 [Sphingobacterium sp. JB170]|nr:hypothetical protein FM107_04645 [Sphingobacterium sp. JB170]